MFVAGTNSSASVMEWTLAELIKNPHIFQRAREEIDSIVGKNRLVRESDIPNLPYIQAIVKETMRLHTPSPLFPRESTKSCKIGGYDVPENATLIVNVWAIARDPNYWDNPLEYCPERFISKEEAANSIDVRGQHYQLLPFGSGRRGCPGASLALSVIQTTLASMIQCFDWNVHAGNNNDIDMAEKKGLTLFLAKPLVCRPVAHFVPFSTV